MVAATRWATMNMKDCNSLKHLRRVSIIPVLKLSLSTQHYTVTTTPLLKDLYEHITPQYAADWKEMGTLLGIPSGELRSIEAGYPTNVKWCCNKMLEIWLESDSSASWGKLIKAIESSAVSGNQVPIKGD